MRSIFSNPHQPPGTGEAIPSTRSELRSNQPIKMRPIPILLFCALFAFGAVSCRQAELPPAPAPKPLSADPSAGTLSGKASLVLKQGQSIPLAGLELLVTSPDAAIKVKEVREKRWLEIATPRTFGDGYNNLDLQAIGLEAMKYEVGRTKADDDGKFTVTGLKPGDYFLYAQYKSRYAAGYWIVPFKAEAGKITSLDLNNDNLKEIFNRFK
jgi:hypothetical protein